MIGKPCDRASDSLPGKKLGFRVTGEGVETLEQAKAPKYMDCDVLQGCYFSRPVPAADIPALLHQQWLMDEPERGRVNPVSSMARAY